MIIDTIEDIADECVEYWERLKANAKENNLEQANAYLGGCIAGAEAVVQKIKEWKEKG